MRLSALRQGRRPWANERGVVLLGALVLSLAVAALGATYLIISRAEVKQARIPSARSRALYDALGELRKARLLIERSRYRSDGANLVLRRAAGGTIPGTRVRVEPVGQSDDPFGRFFRLVASATYEDVTVTVRQLVAERESFAGFLTLVADANLGIAGLLDENYDPNNPPALPPAPLSRGRVHTNRQMELFFPGWRHFLAPITGGIPGGNWVYKVGAEPEKQIFWFPEESRPDAPQVAFPDIAAYDQVRALLLPNAVPVDFPGTWADGCVLQNERGYLVRGDVDVLVSFNGTQGTFDLTLRQRSGSHRTFTARNLPFPTRAGVLFVENGYDPESPPAAPRQTVHVKGDLTGRLTIFAPTGDIRIAGNVRYVDAEGDPAAYADASGIYRRNPAYDGRAVLGLIAEFDVRLGIRPVAPTWSRTRWHIDAQTGRWVYTGPPGLSGRPVGPRGEYTPVEENWAGYLGGVNGNTAVEVHAAIFARRGRLYVDGMNPLSFLRDVWGYRLGYDRGYVKPFARPDAALYLYGSVVCTRRPVTQLVDPNGSTLIGWGRGQMVYDEELALNSPPYFFRHNRPVFYDIQVANVSLP